MQCFCLINEPKFDRVMTFSPYKGMDLAKKIVYWMKKFLSQPNSGPRTQAHSYFDSYFVPRGNLINFAVRGIRLVLSL